MKTEEVIKILIEFNEWRRGGDGEQPDPKVIGEAIDEAINKLKNK